MRRNRNGRNVQLGPESVATLPPFGPIEGQKWFDRISSQWESPKNRFAMIYFGKIRFLPPCIWNIPFMSYSLGQTDGKNWGMVWRNRKKISQIIKDYFHLPFFLLFILWVPVFLKAMQNAKVSNVVVTFVTRFYNIYKIVGQETRHFENFAHLLRFDLYSCLHDNDSLCNNLCNWLIFMLHCIFKRFYICGFSFKIILALKIISR